MKFQYTYDGSEVIIRDLPVYRAAALAAGTLMMKSNSAREASDPDSGADQGLSLIYGYSSTVANQGVNALGVLLEDVSATAAASTYATTAGPTYAKVITNPGAVYQCEHSQSTSDDVAITAAYSTGDLTVTALDDDIDGNFVYFPLTAAGVKGSLRLITTSSAGGVLLDSVLSGYASASSSDTIVILSGPMKNGLQLTTDATKMTSGTCRAAYFGSGTNVNTNFAIIETYIQTDGYQPLRPNVHKGLDNLHKCNGGAGPKFFYDITLRNHFYGHNTPRSEAT